MREFLRLLVIFTVCIYLFIPMDAIAQENSSGVEIKNNKGEKEHTVLFPFYTGQKWGYMNKGGDIIINPKYDSASYFSEGKACVGVKKDSLMKYGFIDEKGKVIIPIKYHFASSFKNSNVTVGIEDDPYGSDSPCTLFFIDDKGEILIKTRQYMDASPFIDGISRVTIGSETIEGSMYIDRDGKFISDKLYVWGSCFSEGLACVMPNYNDKISFIDRKGKVILKTIYHDAGDFSQGLASVALSDKGTLKWGYIDKTGTLKIPLQFEEAKPFSEGLAAVKVSEKWGFIDQSGKYLVKPKYANVSDCKNGLFAVKDEKELILYYSDLKGNIIKPKI